MIEVRTKDLVFLAVAFPLAVAAVYWFGWRTDAVRRIGELERRQATLVSEENFAFEMAKARRELASAEEELAAERKMPPPTVQVRTVGGVPQAERERGVLSVLRASGLLVTSVTSSSVEERGEGLSWAGDAHASIGGERLKAAGACEQPILRVFSVEGRYPQVVKALERFEILKMAVVPERLEMTEGSRGRWNLSIWL